MKMSKKVLPMCILGCALCLNVFAAGQQQPNRPDGSNLGRPGGRQGLAPAPAMMMKKNIEGNVIGGGAPAAVKIQDLQNLFANPNLQRAYVMNQRTGRMEEVITMPIGRLYALSQKVDRATGMVTYFLLTHTGGEIEFDSSTGVLQGEQHFGPNGNLKAEIYVDTTSSPPSVIQREIEITGPNGTEVEKYTNAETGEVTYYINNEQVTGPVIGQ